MKIYLFRHGQTHFNRAKRFTGWKDSTCTTTGHKNARTVAKKLKGKHIDVAFTSHLTRSTHTMKEVLKFHPECKLKFIDDRMLERCYGKLQGRTHAAFIREEGRELFDKYHRAYNFPPPKGESLKMVERRVKPFIKDLLAFIKKYHVNVAISAHGNSMRPFRRHFEKFDIKKMTRIENPYNNYFEYNVKVTGKPSTPSKKSWKPVRLPGHVRFVTDKHNVFKKYYRDLM